MSGQSLNERKVRRKFTEKDIEDMENHFDFKYVKRVSKFYEKNSEIFIDADESRRRLK